MMIQPNWAFSSLICAVVIVVLSVIATNASAQQDKIDQLLQSAEQGDANAQYDLGIMYFRSRGFVQAVKWFRLAAEQGLAAAQSRLGLMYYSGEGVTRDYMEAAKWYHLAAEEGEVSAQYSLGAMYVNGKGVPQDDAEAAKWHRLAAEQGDASAMNFLGFAYRLGRGIPQDYVEAHKWHNLAASRSTGDLHGRASEQRDSVAQIMTPAQIAEAQRLAREWVKAHEDN